MSDTKDKILDAAERLFGEQGYGATSLRHIIAEAGVNLAAIHYHFGTKEALLDQLVERRIKPTNEARIAMLEKFEAEAGGAPVTIEKILEAFLWPAAEMAAEHPRTVKLMGRVHMEGLMPAIVDRHLKPVGMRFVDALRRTLPDIPEQEFHWRVEYMIGAMAHGMVHRQILNSDAKSTIEGSAAPGEPDIATRVACLVAFVSGGFHAPAVTAEMVKVSK